MDPRLVRGQHNNRMVFILFAQPRNVGGLRRA
jgi:hypothetical protein